MAVRPATPTDAETLARMRYAFRSAMNDPVEDEEAFVARCAPWMASRLDSHGPWRCWVFERDGVTAGHLWLCLVEKVPNPVPELESHAYITNVYVSPAARGAGAGAALMEAAITFCRAERVDSVFLWPTERSRTLYARHGFREPSDMMEAILDDARQLH